LIPLKRIFPFPKDSRNFGGCHVSTPSIIHLCIWFILLVKMNIRAPVADTLFGFSLAELCNQKGTKGWTLGIVLNAEENSASTMDGGLFVPSVVLIV
jgi:hypothetical protein